MASAFDEDLWTLPGPSRWIAAVARQLQRRANVVLDLPRHGAPGSVLSQLEHVLGRAAFAQSCDLDVGALERSRGELSQLVSAIAQHLGDEAAEVERPVDLIQHLPAGGLRIQIDLRGFDTDSLASIVKGLDFLGRLFASTDRRSGGAAMVVVVDDDIGVTGLENLEVATWRSVLRPIDAHVFAANQVEGQSRPMDPLVLKILADLAGTDLELIDMAVQERWRGDMGALEEILCHRWERRGLKDDAVESCDEGRLWRLDCEVQTSTRYPNPYRLSLDLPKMRQRVMKELWRAELGHLLPLLEDDRRRVVELAVERSKKPFIQRLEKPNDYGQSCHHLEAEISSLFYHRAAFMEAKPFIEWLRKIRNDLAHGQPVTFSEFERGVGLRRSLFDRPQR